MDKIKTLQELNIDFKKPDELGKAIPSIDDVKANIPTAEDIINKTGIIKAYDKIRNNKTNLSLNGNGA